MSRPFSHPLCPIDALPLIDVSGLYSSDIGERARIATLLGDAARDIGFFRISAHGIPLGLIEAAYSAAQQFFAMPEKAKMQYYIGNSRNHRGYVPFTEKGDYADEVHRNYEAFDLGLDLPDNDPDFLAGNLILGPNVWPDLMGFKPVIALYYAKVAALGRVLTTALERYLGLRAGALTDHMDRPVSQLRLLHYVRPPETTDQKSVNMGAHTD
jgi:isopenicillin N synthase-like dioxygenase